MPDRSQRFSVRHPWLARFALLFGSLVLAELLVRLLVGWGVLPYQYNSISRDPQFWDDLNDVWGVWHHPNATFRHRASCFDVTYHTNAHGMRDAPREVQSTAPRRVVMLGDSVLEGYGVVREERFSNLLEADSGVEHLNFGTACDFGTVQQYLLYREFAHTFDHTEVHVLTLPFNDASDNHPRHFSPSRFRPYMVEGSGGELEITYPVDFEHRERVRRPPVQVVRNAITNNVYLFNVVRTMIRRLRTAPPPLPSYANYSEFDQRVLLRCYERIIEVAGDRTVHLFTLPSLADIEAGMAGEVGPLPGVIESFASRFDNVDYTDLLPAYLAAIRDEGISMQDAALPCDGHPNALGHRLIADAIARAVADQ